LSLDRNSDHHDLAIRYAEKGLTDWIQGKGGREKKRMGIAGKRKKIKKTTRTTWGRHGLGSASRNYTLNREQWSKEEKGKRGETGVKHRNLGRISFLAKKKGS